MATARWHLTYSQELLSEPIVWALGTELGLITNIRRADVRDHIGWLILEVQGDPQQIEAGKRWLEQRGLRVADLTAEQ
jgi:L-aspartate semialdehyde sulfurtransferase ferredoxin